MAFSPPLRHNEDPEKDGMEVGDDTEKDYNNARSQPISRLPRLNDSEQDGAEVGDDYFGGPAKKKVVLF